MNNNDKIIIEGDNSTDCTKLRILVSESVPFDFLFISRDDDLCAEPLFVHQEPDLIHQLAQALSLALASERLSESITAALEQLRLRLDRRAVSYNALTAAREDLERIEREIELCRREIQRQENANMRHRNGKESSKDIRE